MGSQGTLACHLEYPKWQGVVPNKKIEEIVWKTIFKACVILDHDVIIDPFGTQAWVQNQIDPHEEWCPW